MECTGGASNAAVAAKLRTIGFTVGLWRNRFIDEGVAGLGDEPRPGAPRQIGDEKIERLVRLTLEKTPKGAIHWSSRMLAAKTGLSQSTISRNWRAFGLKPHRAEGFQLSSDLLLIDKVRDIVGLYLDPPHHALVLCVDEKSQIQALKDQEHFAIWAMFECSRIWMTSSIPESSGTHAQPALVNHPPEPTTN